jgi:hypothetical protein
VSSYKSSFAFPCLVFCIAVTIACADGGAREDAAVSSDAGSWVGARGLVRLILADDTIATGDTLDLAVASMELVSDRDPETEPTRTDLGRVHVESSGLDVEFDRVVPGLYSAIDIELGGGAPVLEATLHTAGQTFVIRMSGALSLSARCEHGQPITVAGTLRIGVDFALDGALAALSHHPLPPPIDGVIVVDETSAPDAIADVRRTLAASIHAECAVDER